MARHRRTNEHLQIGDKILFDQGRYKSRGVVVTMPKHSTKRIQIEVNGQRIWVNAAMVYPMPVNAQLVSNPHPLLLLTTPEVVALKPIEVGDRVRYIPAPGRVFIGVVETMLEKWYMVRDDNKDLLVMVPMDTPVEKLVRLGKASITYTNIGFGSVRHPTMPNSRPYVYKHAPDTAPMKFLARPTTAVVG